MSPRLETIDILNKESIMETKMTERFNSLDDLAEFMSVVPEEDAMSAWIIENGSEHEVKVHFIEWDHSTISGIRLEPWTSPDFGWVELEFPFSEDEFEDELEKLEEFNSFNSHNME